MRRALLGVALIATLVACGRKRHEPLITSFDADHALSLRYPASWTTEQVDQEGVWYRYFLAPPAGPERKPAVSVTLLAGPLTGSLEEYAEPYLAGNQILSQRDERRQGASGRSYELASSDGTTRHSLLLLAEGSNVYGLYAQGDTVMFAQHSDHLVQMFESLTLERPESYPEQINKAFRFSVRIPPSWRSTHSFSGRERLLQQHTSPALAADAAGETVHASLTLTVEPAPGDGSVDAFYAAIQERLGDSFRIISHAPWRGGYADLMHSETPVAASREKRYYMTQGGLGYSLSCSARDDVFHRVSRWCDLIAGTFEAVK
jgi:hypothetical protein